MTRRVGELPDVHVNPAVIGARIDALDAGIRKLAEHANDNADRLGVVMTAEVNAFVRRWQVERGSYRDWTARALRVDWGSRVARFEAHYLDWGRRVEKRLTAPEPRTTPAPQHSLADAFIPAEAWWLLAGVTAFYVVTRRR